MARVSLVLGLCLVVGGLALGTASASAQSRPLLGVTDMRPFEVRGTGFEPGERVQVLLAVDGRQLSRSTVASAAGVFRVSFRASLGQCGRFTLHAFGSRGSRARMLPRRPLIDCVSPTGTGPRA